MVPKKKKNYGVCQYYINTNKKGPNIVCIMWKKKKMKTKKNVTCPTLLQPVGQTR